MVVAVRVVPRTIATTKQTHFARLHRRRGDLTCKSASSMSTTRSNDCAKRATLSVRELSRKRDLMRPVWPLDRRAACQVGEDDQEAERGARPLTSSAGPK